MNNLIIYSDLPLYNSDSAAGNRMTKYAKAIASNNCRVFILSNRSMHQPESKKQVEFSSNCFYTININNKRVNPWSFIKYINHFGNSLGEQHTFLFYPSNSFMLDILSIGYLKLIKRNKIYIEVNERRFYYKNSSIFRNVPLFRFPGTFIKYLLTKVSMSIAEIFVPYYDGAVFISKNIEAYFKKKMKRSNYAVIPILCESENLECASKELQSNDVFNMAFSGQINVWKENLNLLFSALGRLKKEGVQFSLNLYGPIINRSDLEELIKTNGISSQVKIYNNIEYIILKNELQNNHLLLLVRGETKQNNFGFSTKLSDYLSSGVPVLATTVSDNGIYLTDLDNAFLIKPDSETEIFEKLKFIINNYNIYAPILCKGSKKLVDGKFAFRNYGDELIRLLF